MLQNETSKDQDEIIEQIVRELNAGTKELPEDAIRKAQKFGSRIVPRLIQAIQTATERAATGEVPY